MDAINGRYSADHEITVLFAAPRGTVIPANGAFCSVFHFSEGLPP
jgi:hypothetical protein